jgi:hypothetical protein
MTERTIGDAQNTGLVETKTEWYKTKVGRQLAAYGACGGFLALGLIEITSALALNTAPSMTSMTNEQRTSLATMLLMPNKALGISMVVTYLGALFTFTAGTFQEAYEEG